MSSQLTRHPAVSAKGFHDSVQCCIQVFEDSALAVEEDLAGSKCGRKVERAESGGPRLISSSWSEAAPSPAQQERCLQNSLSANAHAPAMP